MNPFSIAGVVSGLAGLIAFLILHQLWIKPIWFILPLGLVVAVVGGLAVGWAYQELLPYLPPRPRNILALSALIVVILAPACILAELRNPMFDTSIPGGRLTISIGRAAAIFVFELLVTSTVIAGVAGWLIAGTRRAVVATAIAGFIFALGPGHNIPLIGGTPGVGKELALIVGVILVSALVLVEAGHQILKLNK